MHYLWIASSFVFCGMLQFCVQHPFRDGNRMTRVIQCAPQAPDAHNIFIVLQGSKHSFPLSTCAASCSVISPSLQCLHVRQLQDHHPAACGTTMRAVAAVSLAHRALQAAGRRSASAAPQGPARSCPAAPAAPRRLLGPWTALKESHDGTAAPEIKERRPAEQRKPWRRMKVRATLASAWP